MRPVLTLRGERQIPNGRDDATEPAERSEIASCQAARTERRDLRQRWGRGVMIWPKVAPRSRTMSNLRRDARLPNHQTPSP
jgi:hypothetical protein